MAMNIYTFKHIDLKFYTTVRLHRFTMIYYSGGSKLSETELRGTEENCRTLTSFRFTEVRITISTTRVQ